MANRIVLSVSGGELIRLGIKIGNVKTPTVLELLWGYFWRMDDHWAEAVLKYELRRKAGLYGN